MGLMKCKGCGIPRLFRLGCRWTDDGIIESMPRGLRRMLFMERKYVVELFQRIQERLGIPIDRIIFDAKRKDTAVYVSDLLPPRIGKVLRLLPLRRLAYLTIIRQAALVGLGKVKLLEYKTGVKVMGKANPVYHHAFFAGDCFGAFESIEGVRAIPNYGFIGSDFIVNLEPWFDAPQEERLRPEEGEVVPAQPNYDRCGVCGIPLEITHLRWEPETGKVIDSRTGEWIFFQGIGAVNAVCRELEHELGEEVPRLIGELTWRYYSRLRDDHPQAFKDLGFMKARGIGVPDIDNPSADELKKGVNIRNGFNGPILAGMVAAVLGGDSPEWSWEMSEEGVLKIMIT